MLFDSLASRASAVAAFMLGAVDRDEPIVIVAMSRHWELILEAAGESAGHISRGLGEGRIAFRDADVVLAAMSHAGYPEPALFDGEMRSLLEAIEGGPGLNVYGEFVDLLVLRGEFDAAIRLEHLLNDFLFGHPIHLLCGYDATNFAPQGAAARLRDICDCHTGTRMSGGDTLGRWLLTEANIPFGEPAG